MVALVAAAAAGRALSAHHREASANRISEMHGRSIAPVAAGAISISNIGEALARRAGGGHRAWRSGSAAEIIGGQRS